MIHKARIDTLVGQTHFFGGFSHGNIASMQHKKSVSNPKEAALQGLEKMLFVKKLGIPQIVFPPQERPHLITLLSLGFKGSVEEIFAKASKESFETLLRLSSSSSMWSANSAHITPSSDTEDGKVHITAANLASQMHRAIEAPFTEKLYRKVFCDSAFFQHHDPLPPFPEFSDEGQANTVSLSKEKQGGVHLFVYGRSSMKEEPHRPKRFQARQTREAQEAIARQHGIQRGRVLFAKQKPSAIDQGVFHNDVISMGQDTLFIYHEEAFFEGQEVIETLSHLVETKLLEKPTLFKVPSKKLTVNEAIASYFFNADILSIDGKLTILFPTECKEMRRTSELIEELKGATDTIEKVHYLNVRQSMFNGGGPGCLRARIDLNEKELASVHRGVLLDETLYGKLETFILSHYRDRLFPDDLRDPLFYREVCEGLEELTRILSLGSIYPFQNKRIKVL